MGERRRRGVLGARDLRPGTPTLRLAALLCVSWPASAAAQTGLEFLEPQDIAFVELRGTVREHAGGTPVSGASVLAIWEGTTYGFHGSARHCLRIDAARTAADGSFSFATPAKHVYRKGMAQQYVDIRIHRTGMEERFAPGTIDRNMKLIQDKRSFLARLTGPKELGLDMDVRLVASKEDIPDRLVTLERLARQPSRCETTGDAGEVQAYFEAHAVEARSLAKTRYQRAVAAALESDAGMVFSTSTERQDASSRIMQQAYAAPEPEDLDRRDRDNLTPLMKAASDGNVDAVRALLAAGANPNRLTRGECALTLAMSRYLGVRLAKRSAAASYPAVIQALLADPRSDINLRDRPTEYTPLMKALRHRQDDVVELLLAAGADPNLVPYGQYTALGVALKAMGSDIDGRAARQFDLLLASKRVNLDAVIGSDEGGTPLTRSLAYGDNDMARRLLEAGASPNAMDRMKRTAITASTSAAILNPQRPKFLEGVRLVAAWPGVDFEALYDGKTALQMARDARRDDLVAILQKR